MSANECNQVENLFSLGEVVLAPFEEEWYRAVVLSPDERGSIVQYLDYGNMEVLKPGDIQPAPLDKFIYEIRTRDFIVDSEFPFNVQFHHSLLYILFSDMPQQMNTKQSEIIASGTVIITNIHKDEDQKFHCNIFGF